MTWRQRIEGAFPTCPVCLARMAWDTASLLWRCPDEAHEPRTAFHVQHVRGQERGRDRASR